MRPRDWFSVGIRLFGLWVIYRGFTFAMYFVADCLSLFTAFALSNEWETAKKNSKPEIFLAAGYLILGFIFVYGGERLTRLVFNEPSPLLGNNNADDLDQSRSV